MSKKRAPLVKETPKDTGSAEERHHRIAEAAYLRAAAREFTGGDPLRDWLEAEQQINESSDPESTASR